MKVIIFLKLTIFHVANNHIFWRQDLSRWILLSLTETDARSFHITTHATILTQPVSSLLTQLNLPQICATFSLRDWRVCVNLKSDGCKPVWRLWSALLMKRLLSTKTYVSAFSDFPVCFHQPVIFNKYFGFDKALRQAFRWTRKTKTLETRYYRIVLFGQWLCVLT